MSSPTNPKRILVWGLLARKERWGLTWRGWLTTLALFGLTGCLLLVETYPFLAITQRVDANFMAVEGWVHEYAIRAAADEFKHGSFQRIFTTGGPGQGSGGYTNDYNTAAGVAADRLRKAGVAADTVQMVPIRSTSERDRTYNSAIVLRNWFRQNNVPVQAINIVTEDVHARRTRMLFQKALGNGVKVGIIAVPNPDYDATHWWRYSEGVRETIGETIAYLYARFIFSPPPS